MILGMEIAIMIVGLSMLIRGKGIGKNAVADWRFRILGAFLITLFPVGIVAVIMFGLTWAILHPNDDMAKMQADTRLYTIGIEAGIAILYAIIGTIWDKAIRKRIGDTPASQAEFDASLSE